MPSSVSCTIHAALVFLALWLTWPSCHATTFYYHKMTCYHGKYEFALQKAELCSTTLQQHEEQQQQQSSWFQSKWEQLTQVTSQDQESSDGGDSSSGNGVLSWFQTQWSNVKENFQQQEQQQQQQMGDSWEDGEQDTEQQASENQQQSQLTQVCSNDGDIFALGGILTSSQVLFPHFYEVKARLCHYHFNGTSLGCKFEKTIESGELSSFTRYGEVCGQIFAQHNSYFVCPSAGVYPFYYEQYLDSDSVSHLTNTVFEFFHLNYTVYLELLVTDISNNTVYEQCDLEFTAQPESTTSFADEQASQEYTMAMAAAAFLIVALVRRSRHCRSDRPRHLQAKRPEGEQDEQLDVSSTRESNSIDHWDSYTNSLDHDESYSTSPTLHSSQTHNGFVELTDRVTTDRRMRGSQHVV